MPFVEPRLQRSLAVSLAAHSAALVCAVWLARLAPVSTPAVIQTPAKLIYFERSGPGGGGGGSPLLAASEPIAIPRHATPPPAPVVPVAASVEPPPIPVLSVPVQTEAASMLQAPGASFTLPPGPGGRGKGTGLGDGAGPGLNSGRDGGEGGGAHQIGGDVLSPTVIRSVQPSYTTGALLAKLQGTVELEIVIRADGTVSDVRVTRSLDRVHGLDAEAIKTARQWVFRPATRHGTPVDVVARLLLAFRIH